MTQNSKGQTNLSGYALLALILIGGIFVLAYLVNPNPPSPKDKILSGSCEPSVFYKEYRDSEHEYVNSAIFGLDQEKSAVIEFTNGLLIPVDNYRCQLVMEQQKGEELIGIFLFLKGFEADKNNTYGDILECFRSWGGFETLCGAAQTFWDIITSPFVETTSKVPLGTEKIIAKFEPFGWKYTEEISKSLIRFAKIARSGQVLLAVELFRETTCTLSLSSLVDLDNFSKIGFSIMEAAKQGSFYYGTIEELNIVSTESKKIFEIEGFDKLWLGANQVIRQVASQIAGVPNRCDNKQLAENNNYFIQKTTSAIENKKGRYEQFLQFITPFKDRAESKLAEFNGVWQEIDQNISLITPLKKLEFYWYPKDEARTLYLHGLYKSAEKQAGVQIDEIQIIGKVSWVDYLPIPLIVVALLIFIFVLSKVDGGYGGHRYLT